MKKDDFYIGWQDKISVQTSKVLKRTIVGLFIVIPLLMLLIVILQKPFNDFQFEFGNVKEFTGIYHSTPIPMMELTDESSPDNISNYVILVGYGKLGAKGIMQDIESKEGALENAEITIQGTLIYGDGKGLIELTKEEKSLVSINVRPEDSLTLQEIGKTSKVELRGEIIDPKCYFGVMKPAEGKVHKSCAIRCISGGIPPILKVFNPASNKYAYYILLKENKEEINQEILEYVAEDVSISGSEFTLNGWRCLYVQSIDKY